MKLSFGNAFDFDKGIFFFVKSEKWSMIWALAKWIYEIYNGNIELMLIVGLYMSFAVVHEIKKNEI